MPIVNVAADQVSELKQWYAGTNETNGEPVLVIELHDGRTKYIQLSSWAAREMSEALLTISEQTNHKRPNHFRRALHEV